MSENHYTSFAKAKSYTKQYELDSIDSIVTRQEDGMLGYISAGQFATTGSNIFTSGQLILGNLTIDGDIFANEFLVTTSSTEHFTASTSFGLDQGDTHTFTGSVKITGSLDVIGATTTLGNTIMTGSLLVSGSTTQIGNNTLKGNTILSGSIDVSGSQHFVGTQTLSGSFLVSGSTTQYGNNTLIGNTTLSGSLMISGSITGSLQIDGDINLASPHNFYRWGNRLFNYANYYNTGSVNLVSGSATTLNYTSDVESGFTLVSGSQITAAYTGYYNIQFSVQLVKPGTNPADVEIWYSKNGQNIPNTNSIFTIPFKANLIAALNFFVPLNAGDYVELKATTNDSSVDAVTLPANGFKPASPAVVVTISQIS